MFFFLHKNVLNVLISAHIDDVNQNIVRSVRNDLFTQPPFGEYTDIAKQVKICLDVSE